MADSKMTIKKVKCISDGKKKCIQIEYRLSRDEIDDELSGLFREEAAPEFYAALEALREHVEEILEIYGKGLGTRITPYAVTYHYSKDGTMGAIISSKFALPDAGTCIVLNTPMRKAYSDSVADGVVLTEEATKALWKVEQETQKYIAGKRAQMSLFGENGEVAPDTSQEVEGDNASEDYSEGDEEGQENPLDEYEGQISGKGRGAVIVPMNREAAAAAI